MYSSPLSLRDISPQGGERLEVVVCHSSPLSLRDISPQGGERLEMCICIKKETIIYLCKMFIVILDLEYNVKLNIIHKFIIYFFIIIFLRVLRLRSNVWVILYIISILP